MYNEFMSDALPPKVQRSIDRRVQSGKYRTRRDVIIAAMEHLDQHERLAQLSAAELAAIYPGIRRKIAHGVKQADAGKLSDGEGFLVNQLQKVRRRAAKRKSA
jgi:Arc/MetJ-type ribon-helix-helix transcriptional regulator